MAEAQKRRIIFMGTPEFAAIILKNLLKDPSLEIAAIFTQPDKKSGRGLKKGISAVKKLAIDSGLPCYQPSTLRDDRIIELLKSLNADFIIAAAYGLILPQKVLDIPKIAPINVHASLLPKYRGAAPIQRAILENWNLNAKTGVSIMQMSAKLDAGPVYSSLETMIDHKTQLDLQQELAQKGAELLIDTIKEINQNNLIPVAQNEDQATYAEKLEKKDGIIHWNEDADKIDALIRAVTPWPGAQTTMHLAQSAPMEISILSGHSLPNENNIKAGEIYTDNGKLLIACMNGCYEIHELKPQGRKAIMARDFINGYRLPKNGLCGTAGN